MNKKENKNLTRLNNTHYFKCVLCNNILNINYGGQFEFNITKDDVITHFICNSCIDRIINSDKAGEWY